MGLGSSKAQPVRIVMIGLDAAGKTTLLYKLKGGEVTIQIPTIGFNLETMSLSGKTDILSWDVGGRSPMRALVRHYLQGVQGAVFVVDSNDRERMEQAADELHALMSEEALRDAPLLLLANKMDLPVAASLEEVQTAMRLQRLQQPWGAFAISASTFKGVDEAFQWLADRVAQKESGTVVIKESGKLRHVVDSLLPKGLQKLLFA